MFQFGKVWSFVLRVSHPPFATGLSWMLYILHNRIERTFTVTAAGVCTFWLANSKKSLFRLTTKILLYSWMASFTFLLWHYLLKISTQESKGIKSGEGLACWKRQTQWHSKRLIIAYCQFFKVFQRPDSGPQNWKSGPKNQRNRVGTGAYWLPNIFLKKNCVT